MRRRAGRRLARAAWLAVALGGGASLGCTPQGDPAIGQDGFEERFERAALGELWHNTGGPYRIRDGQLHVEGARNKPLWLRRALPRDVRIEVDARSESAAGDIKVELFGDGVSKAESTSYTASGYVVILGGWNNRLNVIARMDEHGSDRVVGPRRPVEPGKTYRLRIDRRGRALTVFVDGERLMAMQDDDPLEGRGHDHFGFNNWESDVWFDNLRITPL
ncbi:MAG: family 16 glycoside hydrolase [Myxococcota bacterium]